MTRTSGGGQLTGTSPTDRGKKARQHDIRRHRTTQGKSAVRLSVPCMAGSLLPDNPDNLQTNSATGLPEEIRRESKRHQAGESGGIPNTTSYESMVGSHLNTAIPQSVLNYRGERLLAKAIPRTTNVATPLTSRKMIQNWSGRAARLCGRPSICRASGGKSEQQRSRTSTLWHPSVLLTGREIGRRSESGAAFHCRTVRSPRARKSPPL